MHSIAQAFKLSRRLARRIGVLAALLGALALIPGAFGFAHVLLVMAALLVIADYAFQPEASEDIAAELEDLRDAHWRLRDEASSYRRLLDGQADIVVNLDDTGRVTFANAAFCKTFGRDIDELTGQTFTPRILEREPFGGHEFAELTDTPSGSRWIAWHDVETAGRDGQKAGCQRSGRDVTAARAAAIALCVARDGADGANRAKSRFLASMSHEIRTPMNGILGMASLLADTDMTPEQRTYCDAVERSAATLLALVDDILDFSKIEAGRLELERSSFVLADCIAQAVELLSVKAEEKDLQFCWFVDPALPTMVMGDPMRVRQIVLNLVSNAVKFTDAGAVRVWVEAAATATDTSLADGQLHISIAVEDTGTGLSSSDARRLFAEFEQGEAAIGRRRGGTGLGLAISDRLARAMGGSIRVDSRLGYGSTFTADIIVGAAKGLQSGSFVDAGSLIDSRVLLALDGIFERDLLAKTITAYGGSVVETAMIDACEVIAASGASSGRFDAVVVDSRSDPVAAAEVLRKAHAQALGSHVTGVVLIPAGERNKLAEFRTAGFERYLVKPIRPRSLIQQLQARMPGAPGVPAHDDRLDKPKIERQHSDRQNLGFGRALIAEDNEVNALLARRVVEKLGWEAIIVGNGRAACAAVAKTLHGSDAPFDIILMDVFMPEMDGFEATGEIKAMFAAASPLALARHQPPIVALTANAFAEDREKCVAAGMDDYLSKPFAGQDLALLVERWASRRRQAAAALISAA